MTARLSALASLSGSLLLHGLIFGLVISSARGAELEDADISAAAVFVGNTFEIETLAEAPEPAAALDEASAGAALR